MFQRIKSGLEHFIGDESANVTVDWVVVIAGVMAFTIVVMTSISGGVMVFGDGAEAELATRELGTGLF